MRAVSGIPLFVSAGLAASNAEARRLIRGGGARVNDEVIPDETPNYRTFARPPRCHQAVRWA